MPSFAASSSAASPTVLQSMDYAAPRWLPGGNLQTILPALYARRVEAPLPEYRRERWATPDGDFIDVDFLHAA